jgi:aspartyl-tRNA(Asn)/glutamyl-tRNA(Gln) amidotransferase subunit B
MTQPSRYGKFEAVIGLEIHCQLSTDAKLFCPSPAKSYEDPSRGGTEMNRHVGPVSAGHPGTLPVLNLKAVEYAIRVGLSIGATIKKRSVFSRKHYFYPDLPKGYQISQFDLPIIENGSVEIQVGTASPKKIHVQRIHIEEDAGKSLHFPEFSVVDLNRASVPLIEIVSSPDLTTPEEAGAYMRELYDIVTYLEVCDGNLQNGNFRCDANVSVRPIGTQKLGTRTEIKNVNSFRFVEKAIEFEINRQIQVIESGGKIVQETRLFDADQGITVSMRSKEEAHDYRYFPEPDLPPLVIREVDIERIRAGLPELPRAKRARYQAEYGMSAYDAGVLTSEKALATFFEKCIELAPAKNYAKGVVNFLTGEIARLLKEESRTIGEAKLTPAMLITLVGLVQDGTLSSTGAKTALVEAWKSGGDFKEIVDRLGLRQVSDLSALIPQIEEVLNQSSTQVQDYLGGKEKLLGFFVGQVMKKTGGKANPALLQELVKTELEKRRNS